jgi:hypothetical protein
MREGVFAGMRKWGLPAMSLVLSLSYVNCASALETGAVQYPVGAETVMPARYPAIPGLFLYSYTLDYSANKFADAFGRNQFDTFSANFAAQAFKIVNVWDTEIFGARPISFVVLPIAHLDASASLTLPLPGGPKLRLSGNPSGLGDMAIAPIALNWQSKQWAFYVGTSMFAPTGSYNPNQPFNLGQNHWAFQFDTSITWNPNPQWQAGGKLTYGISTENPDTHYTNGNYLVAEGSVGYNVNESWGIDLNGTALIQTTDDRAPALATGNRAQVYSIGPQFRWKLGNAGAIVAKWQHEFMARNTTEGDRYWLQFVTPLYVLAKPAK